MQNNQQNATLWTHVKPLHRILVAFLISLFAAFLTSANGQSPPASSSGARLLQGSDLIYVRSFQIPVQYGAGALGFNPKNNSLFIGGSVAAGQQNKPLAARGCHSDDERDGQDTPAISPTLPGRRTRHPGSSTRCVMPRVFAWVASARTTIHCSGVRTATMTRPTGTGWLWGAGR